MATFASSQPANNHSANVGTPSAAPKTVIGLFGGTFDPVHNGHLRMALELQQRLRFDEMRLLPAHRPPHRETPSSSSADRAAMAQLAVAECPVLTVDERELRSKGLSYTVDTLAQFRQEQHTESGGTVSLCWCVGMDSLVNIHTWSRWQQLLDYAHLVVVARPGWELPQQGEVAQWLAQHLGQEGDLTRFSAGKVVVVEQSLLAISATHVRQIVAAGQSPQFLVPESVWRYIQERGLYGIDASLTKATTKQNDENQ